MTDQSQVPTPAAKWNDSIIPEGDPRLCTGAAMSHQHPQSGDTPASPRAVPYLLRQQRSGSAVSPCPRRQRAEPRGTGNAVCQPRACRHPWHGSPAMPSRALLPHGAPLIGNPLGFTAHTCLCTYSCQFICFLRRSANTPLPSTSARAHLLLFPGH